VALVAARQHGVVSRRQLIGIGITGRAIDRRIAAGRLHPVHAGVYAVGHSRLLRYAPAMAAVLASGDDAVASHRTAGWILGLNAPPSGPIEVTVPRAGGRSRRGITVHRTRHLQEVTRCEGIPCTTVARTLVDLAAVMRAPRHLARALERSLELNLFDAAALQKVLARSNGRRGVGTLRRLLHDLQDEPPQIDSELERRFLQLVRDARLPYPVVNGEIRQLRVDFHWPDHKLVVETDGQAVHGHAIAFHRDRARDLQLELADWHVIRLSWRQVVREPELVVAALRRRLR
jgi:very-short-patch-repair endonuclease